MYIGEKYYMVCPNCGNKIPKEATHCAYCKLSVEKITSASNYEAKRAIRNKERDRVVLTAYVPYDVNRTKLLLLCIFLGWSGAHCYYVGRMGRGFTMLACLIIGIFCVAIPQTWVLHAYLSGVVAGAFGFACVFTWWFDILNICLRRFKIPVVLKGNEMPNDE